ncbi:hypothetical protein C3L33_14723, partial [Rhododendron williamsianum]
MGRSPCCAKEGLNRGAWTAMEDKILTEWSLIAGRLPGRTDNEIKNYWNTNIGKKFVQAHPSSTSNRKASNQSKEKSQPPQPRIGSGVVRTKASRCTKVFIRPEPQNSTDHQQLLLEPKPVLGGGPTIHGSDCVGVAAGPDPLDDISPFMISAKDDPSDFIVDFEMDDKFLSDFLNTDFPSLCDEDVETNYTSSSSLNSSPTDLFSTDSVKARFSDEMFNNSDLQSMTSLLGVEWLQE